MKTVATALTELSERVDDESNRRFTLPALRRFLSEGCEEIARRTECLRASANLTVASMDQVITMNPSVDAARLIRIHGAEYHPTGQNQIYPLTYMDRRAMDPLWGTHQAISTSAYPEFYTTWAAPPFLEITLAPIPSEAGTLKIFYYRLPAAIDPGGSGDATNIDLPEGWESVAIDYAEARCWAKDGNMERYNAWMQVFGDRLIAVAETSVRYTDNGGTIIPDSGFDLDFFSSW